jgi:hypothetical protein
MRNPDQRRLPLPGQLKETERDFFLELRRLIDVAGFTCCALEELTASPNQLPIIRVLQQIAIGTMAERPVHAA